MQLLKDNYLQFYGHGQNWKLSINGPACCPENYFLETCKAAEALWSARSGKVYLLYSGGIDSEYTLSIFRHLGMNVQPVIIRLLPNYNAHETRYAFEFCAANNIKPLIIDIDFDQFVKSGEIVNLAKEMECSIYHYSATAYAINQLDGTIVLGEGEPYIKLDTEQNQWNVEIHEYEFCIMRYMQKHNIPGIANFLAWSSEMRLAFLTDSRIAELAANQWPGKLGSNSSKIEVYNRHSKFNLLPRQKYHGYEHVEKSEIFNHLNFKEFDQLKQAWGGIYIENYHSHLTHYQELLCGH